MNFKTAFLITATLLFGTGISHCQSFQIELGKLGIEKGKVYWVKTAINPSTKQVEQTYTVTIPVKEEVERVETVMVPHTEEIEVDGKIKTIEKTRKEVRTKTVPITVMRTETRTRMVSHTTMTQKEETVLISDKFKFSTIDGTKVSNVELKQSIRSGQRIVVVLPPGQKLNDWHRAVLQPGMIVMKLPVEKKKRPNDSSK